MGQLVANTNSYAQQQLLGPEKEQQHSWQPVTAQDLYLWLAIQIHMDLIGVPPERYWMKDGVYLPKDGLPPAAYLGKTRFQEIRRFFHVSPYNSPTEILKAYLVGIQRWIFYWSNCGFSRSSTEYLAAMLLLMKL